MRSGSYGSDLILWVRLSHAVPLRSDILTIDESPPSKVGNGVQSLQIQWTFLASAPKEVLGILE